MLDLWRDHDPERGVLQVRQLWGDKRVCLTPTLRHIDRTDILCGDRNASVTRGPSTPSSSRPERVARPVPHTVNPQNVNPCKHGG